MRFPLAFRISCGVLTATGAAAQPREIETVEVVVTTGFCPEALTDRPGSISVIGEPRLVGVRIRHEF